MHSEIWITWLSCKPTGDTYFMFLKSGSVGKMESWPILCSPLIIPISVSSSFVCHSSCFTIIKYGELAPLLRPSKGTCFPWLKHKTKTKNLQLDTFQEIPITVGIPINIFRCREWFRINMCFSLHMMRKINLADRIIGQKSLLQTTVTC